MSFRRICCGLSSLLVGAVVSSAQGELLVYEPFDYTAGVNVENLSATGLNLSGAYLSTEIQDLVISAPGLTYGSLIGSLPPVAGNRLNDLEGVGHGRVQIAIDDDVLIEPGEAIYFSALLTLNDSGGGNRGARVFFADDLTGGRIGFGEAFVGVQSLAVSAQTPATGSYISAGAGGAFDPAGQSFWMIGRYTNSATPDGDSVELIGYDTAIAQIIAGTFDPADPAAAFSYILDDLDIDLTRITTLELHIRGDANNFIDEVRIGRTYADVTAVPEPGTAAVIAAFGGCVLLRRRRAGGAGR